MKAYTFKVKDGDVEMVCLVLAGGEMDARDKLVNYLVLEVGKDKIYWEGSHCKLTFVYSIIII